MPPIRSSRRQLLQSLGAVLGSAAAVQVAGARNAVDVALAYVASDAGTAGTGKVFPTARLALLRDVCARVIPATDTPGADELDVHGFIDDQLFHCYDEDTQTLAVRLTDAIDAAAIARYGAAFVDAGEERQLEILEALEQGRDGFDDEQRRHFKLLKNLIVFGYLTTETGGTRILAWDPYPGGFTGSVPYASVGRPWLGNVS